MGTLPVTKNGVHKRASRVYATVNGKHRNVSRAYATVNGKHRLSFSVGTSWRKYSCDLTEDFNFTELAVDGTVYDSGNYLVAARDYTFSASEGYKYATYDTVTADRDIYVGYHHIETYEEDGVMVSRVWCLNAWSNGSFTMELVGEAHSDINYLYAQGSTFYGSVSAEEGQVPDEGALVAGSYDEGWCVEEINGTYYYYIL